MFSARIRYFWPTKRRSSRFSSEDIGFPPLRWYHYSDVELGLAWSKDPERYARGSVATGRVSHADSPKEMTQVLFATGWPLGPTSSRKSTFMSRKSQKSVGWDWNRRRSGYKEIKNQEYDGRTSSRGMHCRSYEYEAGRDEMGIETNGGAVGRKPGPGRGCSAIRGRTERTSVCSCQLLFHRCCTLLRGADTTCPLEATLSRQTVLVLMFFWPCIIV